MRFGLLVVVVLVLSGFVFHKDILHAVSGTPHSGAPETEKDKKGKKEKKGGKKDEPSASSAVLQKWELPERLREVSGIAFLDAARFACVQDEEGKIFIYNRNSGVIEKEIPFAGPGDFEGITLRGETAYVVRADGQLFEVPLAGGNIQEYRTPLTAIHNVESLCYDAKGDRLLLAAKDRDPGGGKDKGIYAFDLTRKLLAERPVFRIREKEGSGKKGGGKKEAVRPSAIGIHPVRGEIYVLDGPRSGLLILYPSGAVKERRSLGEEFAQPEGITFSPEGDLFISNEGPKDPANILQVRLNP